MIRSISKPVSCQARCQVSESNAIVRVLRVNDGLENISVTLGWSQAGRFSELESGGQDTDGAVQFFWIEDQLIT